MYNICSGQAKCVCCVQVVMVANLVTADPQYHNHNKLVGRQSSEDVSFEVS